MKWDYYTYPVLNVPVINGSEQIFRENLIYLKGGKSELLCTEPLNENFPFMSVDSMHMKEDARMKVLESEMNRNEEIRLRKKQKKKEKKLRKRERVRNRIKAELEAEIEDEHENSPNDEGCSSVEVQNVTNTLEFPPLSNSAGVIAQTFHNIGTDVSKQQQQGETVTLAMKIACVWGKQSPPLIAIHPPVTTETTTEGPVSPTEEKTEESSSFSYFTSNGEKRRSYTRSYKEYSLFGPGENNSNFILIPGKV